ncbi:hypothetical protein [Aliivibrio logei]|uniref:Uncharacterized protein n=1 Tax=Aliivibrio logei 5S-186 TaxID=626086 RepID=A0ABX3AU51_ALILO|nr:hypothetical protein [Aliivibrio logei]OEF12750.1 hypothetical protein A1Q5_08520 [Aliivibrio logei 5S-186]
MVTFFKKTQIVSVSCISAEGWWIGNGEEHVVKGTALGSDFTQNIYSPSIDGMTARYDRGLNQWSDEVENMTWKQYFNINGQPFLIGEPEGNYPEWAIKETPPKYDNETQTVLYINKAWKVFEIELGKPYWDSECYKLTISEHNFTLPDNHSFIEPPKSDKGFAVRLVNGEWKQLEDHREKIAFAKDRDNDEKGNYQVEELGPIPKTHTLLVPEQFDSWNEALTQWQYDAARYRPVWAQDEKQWQQETLIKVEAELVFYAQDKDIPELYSELRKTHYSEDDYYSLLGDRILLNEYVQQEDFPECGRPTLSGLI